MELQQGRFSFSIRRKFFFTRGWSGIGTGSSEPVTVMALNSRSIWTTLTEIWFNFGLSCVEPGIGVSDLYGSLPTQDILQFSSMTLWFCDSLLYFWLSEDMLVFKLSLKLINNFLVLPFFFSSTFIFMYILISLYTPSFCLMFAYFSLQ